MFVVAGLIFVSLTLALAFLAAFIWAVKSGQFEDVYTPSLRMLVEDAPPKPLSRDQTRPHKP